MSWLIDTDIISLAHKKHLPARLEKWLKTNEADSFISSVSIAEMRYGVEIAPESHKEILSARVAETESLFSEAIEHVTLESLVQWKRIAAFLKNERRTISCEDSLIAAQCLAAGHGIATNNMAHFKLLEPLGLEVINPLA
jgi:predicted nucleic acid-binding protein